MEESKNSGYEQEKEKNPIIVFFTSVLSALKLPFPPKKNDSMVDEPVNASSQAMVDEPVNASSQAEEPVTEKPVIVTFPKQSFDPVKLEIQDEEVERSTNPALLWQVYAIGGYFILRWAWMRWNERKGRKKPDDEPPPAHD